MGRGGKHIFSPIIMLGKRGKHIFLSYFGKVNTFFNTILKVMGGKHIFGKQKMMPEVRIHYDGISGRIFCLTD